MDATVVVSVAAVVVSVMAIAISAVVGYYQVRFAKKNIHVVSFVQLMGEFRKPEFHDHYSYVVNKLHEEHDPASGIGFSDIPEPAKSAVLDVTYFYQIAALFAGFDLLDERQVLTLLHPRIIKVWKAVEPYILIDRQKANAGGPYMLKTLETYAIYAESFSAEEAMSTIKRAELDQ